MTILIALNDFYDFDGPTFYVDRFDKRAATLNTWDWSQGSPGDETQYFQTFDAPGLRCGRRDGDLPVFGDVQVMPGAFTDDTGVAWYWFGWSASLNRFVRLTAITPVTGPGSLQSWDKPLLKSLELDPDGYYYGSGGKEGGPQNQGTIRVWRWHGTASDPIETITSQFASTNYWFYRSPQSVEVPFSTYPNTALQSTLVHPITGDPRGIYTNIAFGPYIFRYGGYWWGWNGNGRYRYNYQDGFNPSYFSCATLTRLSAPDTAPTSAMLVEGSDTLRLALTPMATPPALGTGTLGGQYRSTMQQVMQPYKWQGCVILPDGQSTTMFVSGIGPGDPYYSGGSIAYGDDGRSLWILGPDLIPRPMFTMTWDTSRPVTGTLYENSAQGNDVYYHPESGKLYYTYFTGYAMGSNSAQGSCRLHVMRLDSYDLSTWAFSWTEVAHHDFVITPGGVLGNSCSIGSDADTLYFHGIAGGPPLFSLRLSDYTWSSTTLINAWGTVSNGEYLLFLGTQPVIVRRRSYVIQT